MSCECFLCQRSRGFEEQLNKIADPEVKEYFIKLYDFLICVENDLDYANAIIDGSWPDADKIIEFKRKKRNELHEEPPN